MLSGCKSDPVLVQQISELKLQLSNHRAAISTLQSQVTDGLTLALCSPEIKQLLEDVNKECTQVASKNAVNMCSAKQIRPAVIGADPEHRGRFLKLMSHLPHEVLYLAHEATAVAPYRMTRLEQLARPALLDNTVFLVVTSPELGDKEAIRRAIFIEELLIARGIPSNRIRRWVYDFPANSKDIVRQSDLPGMAEAKELSRGGWVFRADC